MSKKLDIISLYLRDYSSSFTGREISRRIKVSPQTALSVLNLLVRDKILLSKKEGRNVKYSLNRSDLNCKLFIQLAEINKSRMILDNLEIKIIIEELVHLADTIIVFGSFAKGIEKDSSDLDLIIIDAKDKEKIRKNMKIFPREINMEFISWSNFIKSLKDKKALAIEIRKDHLVYGDASKLVNLYCQ